MRRKYGNKKTMIDGIKFDSKKEANRYLFLKSEQEAGRITDLQLQPKFELAGSVKFSNEKRRKPALRYFADFSYYKGGEFIVEDVKSAITKKTASYRIKRHLMLAIHNIEVREV